MYTFKKENDNRYWYRLFLHQWGILFGFNADVMQYDQYIEKDRCLKVSEGLWFRVLDGSTEYKTVFGKDIAVAEKNILKGIKMLSDQIVEKLPDKENALIIFSNFSIANCDYQDEGLTDAVLKWAKMELGVKVPETTVYFNKQLNKYEFSYDTSDTRGRSKGSTQGDGGVCYK